MSRINPVCRVCGIELNDENWYPSFRLCPQYICKNCKVVHDRIWRESNPDSVLKLRQKWKKTNPEKARAIMTRANRKKGHQPFDKNTECTAYLGVHVAEQVLSRVFKDVTRMSYGYPGYDVICNRDKKIDIKSSCKQKNGSWMFGIKHNLIADFFLCLAFDNREDLNPLYIWLVPGEDVNHLSGARICPSTLSKWDEYKLDISKVATCCNTLRNQSATTTESPSFKSPADTHS